MGCLNSMKKMTNSQSQASFISRAGFWLVLTILAILILLPLGNIFARAVYHNGELQITQSIQSMFSSENVQVILNTILLGNAVVFGSTLLALPLAFLTARTTFAHSKWLDIILMIPFMTPPFISSMGWILFTQRRGLFQQLFPMTGDFSEGFISFFGLVAVMSLHLFPFMLTILKNALLNVSSSLEESAAISGGKFTYRLRKVLLPLVSGNFAIGALLVFIKTASEFGTPFTFGRRIGYRVFVTEIHRNATIAPIDFGTSAALSVVLIGICIFVWFVQNYISANRKYKLVGGKGNRTKFIKLKGLPKFLAWTYLIIALVAAIGVPFFAITVTSLINIRGFGMAAGNFSFNHYRTLFESARAISALQNSLFLGLVSATITTILGVVIATLINHLKPKAAATINVIGLLPDMLPSIVFVIGIMLFWNRIHHIIPLYNTIWVLIMAYVALFLPFVVQSVNSSYAQISESLHAAGRIFGGRPLYIFRRITLPLLFRGVLVGWMMTFIIAFRELVTASMIAPPNAVVVSTFIMREFEQGSVSIGMAMAAVSIVFTTIFLIIVNRFVIKEKVN